MKDIADNSIFNLDCDEIVTIPTPNQVERFPAPTFAIKQEGLACHLTEIEPGQTDCWILRASAGSRHLGIETAQQTLLKALEGFPDESLIHYNLSCYACRQGRLKEAKERLAKAIELDPHLKELALQDEDLEGVW